MINADNNWRRLRHVSDPVRSLLDPTETKTGKSRIRPMRRQTHIWGADNAPARPLQKRQQIRRRLRSAQFLEIRHQPPDLGASPPTDGNHALSSAFASCRRAFIRAILARIRSRTGSNGTICPASTSALLWASEASQPAGMLSSILSISPTITRTSTLFQPFRPASVHNIAPPSTRPPSRANTRP
jgi:hypothetical protein